MTGSFGSLGVSFVFFCHCFIVSFLTGSWDFILVSRVLRFCVKDPRSFSVKPFQHYSTFRIEVMDFFFSIPHRSDGFVSLAHVLYNSDLVLSSNDEGRNRTPLNKGWRQKKKQGKNDGRQKGRPEQQKHRGDIAVFGHSLAIQCATMKNVFVIRHTTMTTRP